MYYNPKTKEILSKDALQNRINASFPEGMSSIDGWHLIDEQLLHPELEEGQYAVPAGLVKKDNVWARKYEIRDLAPVDQKEPEENPQDVIKAQAERIAILEKAFEEMAQMVSNLEEYRVLADMEKYEEENA